MHDIPGERNHKACWKRFRTGDGSLQRVVAFDDDLYRPVVENKKHPSGFERGLRYARDDL